MTMSQSLRKLVLTLHVITAMIWLGSAAAYIPIAAYVLNNQDTDMIRSAIQIMSLVANYIVVPVAFATLLTGAALSLGTKWGLIRHYWILIKLLLTLFAVFMLIAYTQELSHAASIASQGILSSADIAVLKAPIHLTHPSGSVFIVIMATVLSVYKPKGMTKYGWRKQMEGKRNMDSTPYSTPRWIKIIGLTLAAMLLLLVAIMAFI
ncbi:hypothetical protein [Paenibacillus brevis]|uniref:DUF2269 domain-containing protein n=1 Tax=Paenibacillus brevis TaxID=2841508 RepID=A0ABS6FPU4_9BACL|nr:hypothetical protein [Paenibacillus brevis]MBU5672149.1 hypothetical protein [Paenibacillus brevis]